MSKRPSENLPAAAPGDSPAESNTKRIADTNPAIPTAPQPAPPRTNVTVDESKAAVCYTNFCRVTGTPEELILDFGLNSNPIGGTGSIEIAQRLVMNYYTAKRLLQALAISVQRHEGAFGVLETDVQKRVTPAARRPTGAG